MGRIKNDPKKYLRREDLGYDAANVTKNRSVKSRSSRTFVEALLEPSFYIRFRLPGGSRRKSIRS